jgi:hypothetical protein
MVKAKKEERNRDEIRITKMPLSRNTLREQHTHKESERKRESLLEQFIVSERARVSL